MLKVSNISKSFGTLDILSKVSFTLVEGQKAALVGENGSGKTTLLKILAGLDESDSGTIEKEEGLRVGYLPQDVGLVKDQTIREYFGARAEHLISKTLAGLRLENISLDRKLGSLSSGQKTKVVLATMLIDEPDLYLLDEPTNNLDIPALIWLEDYLKNSQAAAVIVSHDRRFLDKVADRVFELDFETHALKSESGKYSDFLERKRKAVLKQKGEYERQQEEIERLTTEARNKREAEERGRKKKAPDNDKLLRGVKSDNAGKKLTVGARVLDKIVERMEKIERVDERKPFSIELQAIHSGGHADIALKDVKVEYKDGFELGSFTIHIGYGKRYGFVGQNGSGKTTLLKLISGELKPDSGEVDIGQAVSFGNLTQEHTNLPADAVVFNFLKEKTGLDTEFIYNILAKYGMSEKNIRGKIGELSPGAQARLLLSLFSALSVNTLLLDEPTNHLDFEAVTALEEVLTDYKGTVILVSHDRYFLEKTRLDFIYLLENGKIERIPDLASYLSSATRDAQKMLKTFK